MTPVLEPIEIKLVPVLAPTIADTLTKASDLLEAGWCQGFRCLGWPTRYCALGALDEISSQWVTGEHPLAVFMANYLVSTGKADWYYSSGIIVAKWNNNSDQATVVATFREAAEAARKLGV